MLALLGLQHETADHRTAQIPCSQLGLQAHSPHRSYTPNRTSNNTISVDEPSQAALGSNYGGHRKSAAFLKQLESLRPTLKTQGQASGSLLTPIGFL